MHAHMGVHQLSTMVEDTVRNFQWSEITTQKCAFVLTKKSFQIRQIHLKWAINFAAMCTNKKQTANFNLP